MKKYILGFTFFLSALIFIQAQGSAYILKGGLTMANQRWGNFERDPLYTWHGAAAIESLSEFDQFSLFAQLGIHNKGSAIRYGGRQLRDINNNFFSPPADKFLFRNASLVLGAKSRQFHTFGRTYFLVGLRLDYTLDTNLDEYEAINERLNFFYPLDQFVQKWNYGFTLGGGVEFPFSELVFGIVEFNVHPDISRQYFQPPIDNVYDPFTNTSNTSLSERSIRNTTFELSLGFRFLRKVEYID